MATTSTAAVVPVVLVLTLVLLAVLLRSFAAPWYLALTGGLSFVASLGSATLVFVSLGGGGLLFAVPLTFVVLGLTGANASSQQFGPGIAFAVALDTFFVRTPLVPPIAMMLGRWNWWRAPSPGRPVAVAESRTPARR